MGHRYVKARDLAAEKCPGRVEAPHCLHRNDVQHAMMHHADEYCCFCGDSYCVDTYDPETIAKYRAAHGPNL